MTDPPSAPPPTPPPTDPPRRTGTILGRLAAAVRAQNWAAVAIELAVVVVGVLLGLQANRWNEARTAERDVRALVQNLRGEFASNRASLAATRADLDVIMGASGRVLALVGRPDAGVSDAGLDSLIELTFFWPTWTPSSAASQELVGSGKLSVLDDDGLKPLLFEWDRHLQQVDEGNRRMERSSQDLIDYVKDHGSLRNTNHSRIGVDRSLLAVSNRPLLTDPRFENDVAEKLVMAQFLAYQYREADALIDAILQEAGADRSAPPTEPRDVR